MRERAPVTRPEPDEAGAGNELPPLERLQAATKDLAAAIAVTERLAATRAELLRTVNAGVGVGRGRTGRIVSLAEAARRSGRNPEVLRRWCIDGRIPAMRIGRAWAITEETLALLISHRTRARPRLTNGD